MSFIYKLLYVVGLTLLLSAGAYSQQFYTAKIASRAIHESELMKDRLHLDSHQVALCYDILARFHESVNVLSVPENLKAFYAEQDSKKRDSCIKKVLNSEQYELYISLLVEQKQRYNSSAANRTGKINAGKQ